MRSLDRDDRAADAHSLREGAKAFQRLAQAAADLGAAVDILGTGMSAVNVPLLSTVARASGGSLTLHAGERSLGSRVRLKGADVLCRSADLGL